METDALEPDVVETPLMKAVREEVVQSTPDARERRALREADMLVDDIDNYIAETDPASLAVAEAEIDAWHIPHDPHADDTDEEDYADDNLPLVSVFSAGTETEANIVRGVLESEGVAVAVAMAGTAAYGTVLSVGAGKWGDIYVAPDDAARAREIIAEQMSSL